MSIALSLASVCIYPCTLIRTYSALSPYNGHSRGEGSTRRICTNSPLVVCVTADELENTFGMGSTISRIWSGMSSRSIVDFISEVWTVHMVRAGEQLVSVYPDSGCEDVCVMR